MRARHADVVFLGIGNLGDDAPLLQNGFVTREPDPQDGRGAIVTLTPLGQARFDEAGPAHLANEERLLAADEVTAGVTQQAGSVAGTVDIGEKLPSGAVESIEGRRR